MFTFSKATTSKSQTRPSLRFKTFNGWTSGTIERVRALSVPTPTAKPRKAISWLRRDVNHPPIQSVIVDGLPMPPSKQSISPPLPLNYPPLPLAAGSSSSRPAETRTTLRKDHTGYAAFSCTKMVLVASSDPSRPCRIRRINTRKELPWMPISKPLPPLPSPPACDSAPRRLTFCAPTTTAPSSCLSNLIATAPRNSSVDTLDDGLDDLSLFLRRIAYDVISAPTIHRHLGYMEDGGRVLPATRTGLRSVISPPKRYSSLMGVSLAIMEGRLPKALMVS